MDDLWAVDIPWDKAKVAAVRECLSSYAPNSTGGIKVKVSFTVQIV